MVHFCDEELLEREGTEEWFEDEALAQRVSLYTHMGAPYDEISKENHLYLLNGGKIWFKYRKIHNSINLFIGKRWQYEKFEVTNITRVSRKRLCVGKIDYIWKLKELVLYISNKMRKRTGIMHKYYIWERGKCEECGEEANCDGHHRYPLNIAIKRWFYDISDDILEDMLRNQSFHTVKTTFTDVYFEDLKGSVAILCKDCHNKAQYTSNMKKMKRYTKELWAILLKKASLWEL